VRHWIVINASSTTACRQRSSGCAARNTISGRYWIAARCGVTATKPQRNQRFMRNAQAATKPARCEAVHRQTTQWSAAAVRAVQARKAVFMAAPALPVAANTGNAYGTTPSAAGP
jgi:hypothetical protein